MSPNLNWILNPNNFDLGFIRIEISVQIHSDSKSRIKSDIFSTDLHRKRLKTFVGLTRLSSDWLEFRVNRIGFGISFNPKLCQGWNLEMMSCRKLIKLKKTENFNLFEIFFFNCYFKNIVSSDVSDSSSGYECISFFYFFYRLFKQSKSWFGSWNIPVQSSLYHLRSFQILTTTYILQPKYSCIML